MKHGFVFSTHCRGNIPYPLILISLAVYLSLLIFHTVIPNYLSLDRPQSLWGDHGTSSTPILPFCLHPLLLNDLPYRLSLYPLFCCLSCNYLVSSCKINNIFPGPPLGHIFFIIFLLYFLLSAVMSSEVQWDFSWITTHQSQSGVFLWLRFIIIAHMGQGFWAVSLSSNANALFWLLRSTSGFM